ncbi:hypothetical protein ABEY24_10185 [Peribacillus frigoritolerans]|uniref:hypothetical protein n=1 Tax=Peribacillus frigoritolerans TaxID=450367 RepID=UPI003D290B4B
MKKQDQNVHTNTIEHVYVPYALVAVIASPVMGWILVKEKGFKFGELGTFGDFLGGSTVPLLTFITILLLIRTIRLQSNQLDIQKNEFTLLREEMASTKEALQEQSKTAKMQRFENSFFMQIKELREEKILIQKSHSYSNTHLEKFNNVMSEIEDKYNTNMEKLIIEYGISRSDRQRDDFYTEYEALMSEAFDSTGVYEEGQMTTFFYIIERILQIIYHYKKFMDVWELKFYLEYLNNEITSEGINIVLFDLCLHSKHQSLVKELNFNRFVNPILSKIKRREDFRLLDYILNDKPDND